MGQVITVSKVIRIFINEVTASLNRETDLHIFLIDVGCLTGFHMHLNWNSRLHACKSSLIFF